MKLTTNISNAAQMSSTVTPTSRIMNKMSVNCSKELMTSRNQSGSKDKKTTTFKSDRLKDKTISHNNSSSVYFQSTNSNSNLSRNKSNVKSKSKEKSLTKNNLSGVGFGKKENSSKLKKDLLPVSSYKIKLK